MGPGQLITLINENVGNESLNGTEITFKSLQCIPNPLHPPGTLLLTTIFPLTHMAQTLSNLQWPTSHHSRIQLERTPQT